jgi:hypothetical protein
MIDYRFNGRLIYIPGGALSVNMSAWPAAGGSNWWEPTTGSYTVVGAYQAKGAASLAASYVNLANPGTYDLTEGVAPTFDTSYGWDFNGSTMYLTTGIVPTAAMTLIVRFSDRSNAGWLAGVFHTATSARYGLHPAGCNWYNDGDRWRSTPTPASGVMAFAAKNAYLDGVSAGTISSTGPTSWAYGIYIGARNQNGPATTFSDARIQAVAIYSTTLDATQVAEITANMQAL